jgi:UDP-glucose 4-epimerase
MATILLTGASLASSPRRPRSRSSMPASTSSASTTSPTARPRALPAPAHARPAATPVFERAGRVRRRRAGRRCCSATASTPPVHFAAFKAVGESAATSRWSTCANNVGGLRHHVPGACSRHGVRRFVFSSSATVVRRPRVACPSARTRRLSADQPLRPDQADGRDHAAPTSAPPTPSGRPPRLRYFNPVGAHESGLHRRRPARRAQQPDALRGARWPWAGAPVPAGLRQRLPHPRRHAACATTSTWWTWPKATWRRCAACWTSPGSLTVNLGTGHGSQRAAGGGRLRQRASGRAVPYAHRCPAAPATLPRAGPTRARRAGLLGWQARYDLARMWRDSLALAIAQPPWIRRP